MLWQSSTKGLWWSSLHCVFGCTQGLLLWSLWSSLHLLCLRPKVTICYQSFGVNTELLLNLPASASVTEHIDVEYGLTLDTDGPPIIFSLKAYASEGGLFGLGLRLPALLSLPPSHCRQDLLWILKDWIVNVLCTAGYKAEIHHCAPYVGNPLAPYTKFLTLEAWGLTASSPH